MQFFEACQGVIVDVRGERIMQFLRQAIYEACQGVIVDVRGDFRKPLTIEWYM